MIWETHAAQGGQENGRVKEGHPGGDPCGNGRSARGIGDAMAFHPGRGAAAARVAAALDAIERTPEDARRSEEEIMADAIADIAEARRARRAADG